MGYPPQEGILGKNLWDLVETGKALRMPWFVREEEP
jgi:hypothetical protein